MNACEQCGHEQGQRYRGNGARAPCHRCIIESIERDFQSAQASREPSTATPPPPRRYGAVHDEVTFNKGQRAEDGPGADKSLDEAWAAQIVRRYASVDGRPAQQMQMLSSFLDSYFPTTQARAGLAYRRSYLAALPDVEISSSPILRVAIDTLCFAHIGTKSGDSRLIQESQNSYGKVLSSLIHATSRPPGETPHLDPKAVITSIMLLCLYDDAIPSPYHGKNGWVAHYWGCQQLLRVYGTSCLDMDEPFDRLLYFNLRMPLFFLGVAKRKGVALGEPEWLALAEGKDNSQFTQFYQIAMAIPYLLETCDRILHSSHQNQALEKLCSDIQRVSALVRLWHHDHGSGNTKFTSQDPDMFDLEENMSALDVHNEIHCFISTSTVFTKFIRFRGPPNHLVKFHTLKTLVLLVLECTLLRLLHFQPVTAAYMYPPNVQKNANELACDICRSMHHYASVDNLAMADFTEFLIEMALSYFEESAQSKELGWCIAVRVANQLRTERLKKTVQASTLCRIADCGPGFASAMRFKTYHIFAGP